MPSRLVISSPYLPKPSSRLILVFMSWPAMAAAAVAVVGEVVAVVAVVEVVAVSDLCQLS